MSVGVEDVSVLNERYHARPAQEVVAWAFAEFGDRCAVSTAFGAEGCVLVDMVANVAPNAHIFTIDTGRLHEETYALMERVRERYDVALRVYFPERVPVEELVTSRGLYSFRESVESRRRCCEIRKVEPLARALKGLDAWMVGLRREQSESRATVDVVQWDERHGMVKINPLASWTEEDVWRYVRENDVPTNALHKRGYPSIGCAPCTRAIARGEDLRAGRWWWERSEHKECGIHR